MIEPPRRHPDLFTAEEALEYLHRDPVKDKNLLETLRDKKILMGQKVGKEYMYHREELDAAVIEIFNPVLQTTRRRSNARTGKGPRLKEDHA